MHGTLLPRLLVSAGEASGDVFAAPVVARLGVNAFGLGGPALAAVGCRLVAEQADVAVMGIGSVLTRAGSLVGAWHALSQAAHRERPRAALLVGFSEFNARLGRRLRTRGVRVLWYAPPQIWAWRPGRAARLAHASDLFALTLPFESQAWPLSGDRVHYVGHPALEAQLAEPQAARARIGATQDEKLVVLLPGSRSHEITAHLQLLLDAYTALAGRERGLGARVLLARGLESSLVDWVHARANERGIAVLSVELSQVIRAFDLALAVSGTVTLEAALAGVPPVIVYRPGRLVAALGRRWLRVPRVGLPNLVLGEAAFPEIVEHSLRPALIAERAAELLDQPGPARDACQRLQDALGRGLGPPPSARVAELIRPWLT